MEDVRRCRDYIARDKGSPMTALRIEDGIIDAMRGLLPFPYRNALDEDPVLAAAGIRKCLYGRYRIYYYINRTEQTVHILRVLHILVDARPHLLPTRHD